MKIVFTIFVLIYCQACLFAQTAAQSLVQTISLSAGAAQISWHDEQINYYHYQDTAPAIAVKWSGQMKRHQLSASANYARSILSNPTINTDLYPYNEIDWQSTALAIGYQYELLQSSALSWNAGTMLRMASVTYTQTYENLLLASAKGLRFGYYKTLPSFLLSTAITFCPNTKNLLQISGAASLLSYISRPTDNEVKQIGLNAKPIRSWHSPNDQQALRCSLDYLRTITTKWQIGCRFSFTSLKLNQEYHFAQRSFTTALILTYQLAR